MYHKCYSNKICRICGMNLHLLNLQIWWMYLMLQFKRYRIFPRGYFFGALCRYIKTSPTGLLHSAKYFVIIRHSSYYYTLQKNFFVCIKMSLKYAHVPLSTAICHWDRIRIERVERVLRADIRVLFRLSTAIFPIRRLTLCSCCSYPAEVSRTVTLTTVWAKLSDTTLHFCV